MESPKARDACGEQLLCQSSLGEGEERLLRKQVLLGEVRTKLFESFVFC